MTKGRERGYVKIKENHEETKLRRIEGGKVEKGDKLSIRGRVYGERE